MNLETDPMDNQDDVGLAYDFSGGVRGKHYQAYQRASNGGVLDADVAEIFPNSVAVNEALQILAKIAQSLTK